MTYALEVQLLLKCAKEHRESKVRKSLNSAKTLER